MEKIKSVKGQVEQLDKGVVSSGKEEQRDLVLLHGQFTNQESHDSVR